MIKSPLAQKFVVIYAIVSAAALYRATLFPESLRDLFQLSGIGLLFFYVIVDLLFPTTKIKQNFKKEIYLFFIATFLSMYVAKMHHFQDFSITFIAQRFMYFYMFYFVLHSFDLSPRDIERIIIPFGLLYVGLYLLQFFLFPMQLFDARVELARGTVRVFIPGAAFMFLSYFKSLQEFLSNRNYKYLALCILFFIVGGILTGTRQSLATLTLITTAFIFFHKQVKSRLFIIVMYAIAGFSAIIIFHEVFIQLVELTIQQSQDSRPNVRILASRFFLTDFMPADIAYILGNGMDSTNSTFGQRVFYFMEVYGFYQSDVGIIGDYSKFGILFVIAQLSILIKIIFGKLPTSISYIRYYFLTIALTMFSGANAFGRVDGIVFVCLVLYLIDREKSKPESTPDGANSSNAGKEIAHRFG